MFSPEKDFHKLLIETLGKDGKSISSLAKELEKIGYKHHRLILTGYLRALTDIKILKEREIPPAKVYFPAKPMEDNIYEKVGKKCREISSESSELILYALSHIFRRPVFESELKMSGIPDSFGTVAAEEDSKEARRILKRGGVQVPSNQTAYISNREDLQSDYLILLENLLSDSLDFKHLVLDMRQTKLL